MDLGLRGKVALVTAASSGIGRAVAHRLAREGARVGMNARSVERLSSAVASFGAVDGGFTFHPGDLLDAGDTDAVFRSMMEAHGRLDILVMNTPGPRIVPFVESSLADWQAAYDALLRPAVQLGLAAARQMIGQGSGSIVFLTSTWVKQPMAGGVLSASLRSAVSALSKQMAGELAPHGVRVNQVMPGATGTDRMKTIMASKARANGTSEDEELHKVLRDIPSGRWASPEEIADTVAFLASPSSGFTTGVALQIDGGAVRATL